jgi:hypothetical protein
MLSNQLEHFAAKEVKMWRDRHAARRGLKLTWERFPKVRLTPISVPLSLATSCCAFLSSLSYLWPVCLLLVYVPFYPVCFNGLASFPAI